MLASEQKAFLQSLNRIADGVEALVGVQVSQHTPDGGSSLMYQLAGNASGFAEELEAILNLPDQFQKARKLRELLDRAQKLAANYKAEGDRLAQSEQVDSKGDDNPEPAKGQE